ncbi:MAG TPA: aminotransferase class V-fold PLP-dependent enzyme, partial [Clostridia bacterium]|nr:aminotransferase class V-fold PLP-dependent enzyme [Clostridia bacterium]
MNINDEALRPFAGPLETSGFNAEQDRLIASLAKRMAQDFFPEMSRSNLASAGAAPECPEWDPMRCAASAQAAAFPIFSPQCVPEVQPWQGDLDVRAIRDDFPILSEKVHGKDLVWFDNAATTQKPKCVVDRLAYYYEHENSNVHRAAHALASRATDAYEGARSKIATFLHAESADEIIFVRGATEGINLVAQTYALENLEQGDEIVVSMLEHHANIVPWQMICAKKGAKLRAIPVDEAGQIVMPAYERLLNPKTRFVALTQVSNAIGTQPPVAEMVRMAHACGAKTLVDGAQAIAHIPVDVQALDCDFYAFSGHKAFGPTGIGVLYGKSALLQSMPPYQGGGSMISSVTFEKSTYKMPPHRFEAGTGSIADAIGLGAAVDYLSKLGMHRIERYERRLHAYG